uniref:Uncharacterized protein n=1 Tax=Anguilla anguilla TaxID=7936 RepID=A0A0E9VXH3_ANGAN
MLHTILLCLGSGWSIHCLNVKI